MSNMKLETKIKFLFEDVYSTKNILEKNNFILQTNNTPFEGYEIIQMIYYDGNFKYEIRNPVNECNLIQDNTALNNSDFWLDINGNTYSVAYNNDYNKYDENYMARLEGIFESKIDIVFKEYIEDTYDDSLTSKIHFLKIYLKLLLNH